ncbi:MAG TPA: VCBS repeat-containing protein [Anaerolineae bacterium]|nr:VCBS repeat-containing protein [Anaerolineae bacterium]
MVHSIRRLRMWAVTLLLLGPIGWATLPGQTIASNTVTATGCQWTYYPISGGQLQPEQPLFNDPANTPISDLSVGNPFKGKATTLATTGSTDFDVDGKTDVFRTYLRGDGTRQWQYSSGGAGAWQDLAFADDTPLQFGEFNGDTHTDVFANIYNNGLNAYQWLYSPGGTNSFVQLHSTATYVNRLALGDFNGDGVTDVFTASLQSDSFYHWGYFPGGSGSMVPLAYAATDPSLLRFGDFNGDGKTDVFAATQQADGSTQWLYSSGGAASYTNLVTSTVPYAELQFGDFNGDGKTDVLTALPQSGGGLQVVYWSGGLGPAVTLGHIPAPAPALRVGDFNGDGISDLLALRCGMKGPLAFGPLQTLATSGYSTFDRALAGDVNGDGQPDVIEVSTCQNPNQFGNCATHYLQVGTALGAADHTFNLVAPQTLSTDSFLYWKVLAGDFDGDGKTDLALIYLSSSLTIAVAHSNGDGTFTLGAPQVFGNETWNGYNPAVGDFNGDGKTDLAFMTVCHFSNSSCSNGDNNRVYVALSTGTGTFNMGARQDLGAVGWDTYTAQVGDFNGDGKTDLVFNSTCQKMNFIDSTCTIGDANLVYTALSNGSGGFTLSGQQVYGSSGWADYSSFVDLVGDVNGDGRSDLVWSSSSQTAAATNNNLVVAGLANLNGTFQLGSDQNFGSAWTGRLTLADLNHDGRADLLWNKAPLGDTDVDTYATATSNGDGTFKDLGPGAVYTGQGFFSIPTLDAAGKIAANLTLVSTRQDSISNALFVVNGFWPDVKVYLPLVLR